MILFLQLLIIQKVSPTSSLPLESTSTGTAVSYRVRFEGYSIYS